MPQGSAEMTDQPYFKVALLGFLGVLLYLLSADLSPYAVGGGLIILVIMSRRGATLELGVSTVAALLFFVYAFQSIGQLLWPFVLSFILAYLLAPLVGLLSRRLPRTAAIGILMLSLLGLLTLVSNALIPHIIREVRDLVFSLPTYTEYFKGLYQNFSDWLARYGYTGYASEIQQRVVDRLPEVGKLFADQTTSALRGLTSGIAAILNLLMIPFVTFYILKDYDRIREIATQAIPTRHRARALDFIGRVDTVLGQYIRGQLIVSTFIAALTAFGLSVSGVRYAVVLGLTAGALNLIPYVGLTISLGVSMIVALLDAGGAIQCLKVLAVFVVVQGIEGNFLSPRVVGERVGLHPVWVMFALVVSAHLWGVVGMLVAIPVAAVINIVVRIVLHRLYGSSFYDEADSAGD
jgi:predicted PurR-regulated permease PerM